MSRKKIMFSKKNYPLELNRNIIVINGQSLSYGLVNGKEREKQCKIQLPARLFYIT